MKARMTELGSDVIERFEHLENGFYADLEAYYGNTKLIDDFQDVSGWSQVIGLVTKDNTNFKLGRQSIRLSEVDSSAKMLLARKNMDIDLAKLNNGLASEESDYIICPVFVSNADAIDPVPGVQLLFSQELDGTTSNCKYLSFINLTSGWNFLKAKKSDFITNGTGSWTNIKSIRLGWQSKANYSTAYVSFQLIQLVKKDPSEDCPNPFQKFGQRDFVANGEKWFVGYEFGILGAKPLTYGSGINAYSLKYDRVCRFGENLQFQTSEITYNNYSGHQGVVLTKNLENETNFDLDNYIIGFMANGVLYLREVKNGANFTALEKPGFNLPYGTLATLKLELVGTKVVAYLNGIPELSMDITLTGDYRAVFMRTSGDQTLFLKSFSITTISHAHHADVAEVAKSLAFTNVWASSLMLNSGNFQIKSFYVDMTKVAGQNEVEIDLGSGYFAGTLEITVASSHSTADATGSIVKKIDLVGGTEANVVVKSSRYVYLSPLTVNYFMISDVYVVNGRKK